MDGRQGLRGQLDSQAAALITDHLEDAPIGRLPVGFDFHFANPCKAELSLPPTETNDFKAANCVDLIAPVHGSLARAI